MEAFETTLTGSDGSIDGIVTHISKEAYHFASLDDTLHLTIAKNIDGKWVRLSGTEPYFSGWLDELSERIAARPVPVKTHKAPVAETKAPSAPVKKAAVVEKKATSATAKKNAPTEKKSTSATAVKRAATALSKAKPAKKSTATVAASKKGKVSSPATKK